jgi:hypothetical protein
MNPPASSVAGAGLHLRQRLVLAGTIAGFLLFGLVVYHKQIRLRQGDQGVFYRAGWAIREGGADLYSVTDDHGWHYHYPPLFAIFMVPLADPPPGAAGHTNGGLPAWARMALLYLFNLGCLVAAVRLFVGCLARRGGKFPNLPIEPEKNRQVANLPPQQSRRLHLIVWPVAVCLPAIGLTLVRGQVDLLLLLLLAGFTAGLASGRRFTAGMCLAGAISLKIIPLFLLLLPLWRRDWRCLGGCAAGLVLGLWLIPALVLGPGRTSELYATQFEVLVKPALGLGTDTSRGTELLDAGGTVNQSFQMVLHLTLHYGEATPPPQPAAWVRGVHWLLVAALTALVLLRQGRAVDLDGRGTVGLVGLLGVIMVLASPVCHLHYFTLVVPLALVVLDQLLDGRAHWSCWVALLLPPAGYTAFMVPGLASLRDLGLPLYATMALWLAGWVTLRPARPAVFPLPAWRQAG